MFVIVVEVAEQHAARTLAFLRVIGRNGLLLFVDRIIRSSARQCLMMGLTANQQTVEALIVHSRAVPEAQSSIYKSIS